MDKDTALRSMFERVIRAQSGNTGAGASKVLVDGEIYLINRCCVYKGAPKGAGELAMEPDVFARYTDDIPEGKPIIPNNVRPEILLGPTQIMLEDADCAPGTLFLPVSNPPKESQPPGLWVADLDSSGVATFRRCIEYPVDQHQMLLKIPMRATSIPDAVTSGDTSGYKMTELQACIMFTRLNPVPVILLRGETGLLYATLNTTKRQEALTSVILPGGLELVGDGWVDDIFAYKRLIKKKGTRKMKGLGNPLMGKLPAAKLRATAAQEAVEDIAESPISRQKTQEEMAAAAEEAMAIQAAQEAQEAEEDTGACATEEAKEAPEEAQEEAIEEQKPVKEDNTENESSAAGSAKRARAQRAPKAVGLDLAKAIEDIGAPVTEIAFDQFDAAQAEIRALRDLQIATARRIANISSELYKASKVAVDKYTAIQQLLK